MSWLAQVHHVMRKDARHLWWAELLVILALAGAGLEAFDATIGPAGPAAGTAVQVLVVTVRGAPLVLLVTLLFAGLLIHADPPTRSDAFWATRPLAPSAVVAAKAALAVILLLVLPLGIQLPALLYHGVPGGDIPSLMAGAALNQGAILAAAAALAALTRDFRTYVIAVPLAYFAWSLSLSFARAVVQNEGPFALQSTATWVLWVVGGSALLLYQYHVRDTGRVLRRAAVPAVVVVLLLGAIRGSPSRDTGLSAPDLVHASDLQVVDVEVRPSPGLGARNSRSTARLHLRLADAREGYRYYLADPAVRLRLPDGTVSRLQPMDGTFLNPSQVAVPPGFVSLDAPAARPGSWGVLFALVSSDEASAFTTPGARIEIDGRLDVMESRSMDRLPLRTDAEARQGGRTLRIDSVEEDGDVGAPILTLSTESVRGLGSSWSPSALETLGFALLRADRREAVPLGPRSSSGGAGHGMVLPGVRVWSDVSSLDARLSGPRGESIPPGWADGAELYIQEWVGIGSYTVHLETGELPRMDRRSPATEPEGRGV